MTKDQTDKDKEIAQLRAKLIEQSMRLTTDLNEVLRWCGLVYASVSPDLQDLAPTLVRRAGEARSNGR